MLLRRTRLIAGVITALAVGAVLAVSCGGKIVWEDDGSPLSAKDAGDRSDARPASPVIIPEYDAHVMDGYDAGVNPFVGNWVPNPDPVHCPLRVAADPANAKLDWKWQACPSSRPGCRELVLDWGALTAFGQNTGPMFRDHEPVMALDGKQFAAYRRFYKPTEWGGYTALLVVVQQIDGPVIFAAGSYYPELHYCWPALGIGKYGLAYSALIAEEGLAVAWAPWSQPTQLQGVTTSRPTNDETYDVRVGADRMHAWGRGPDRTFLFDTRTFQDHNGPSGSPPQVVPGGLLFSTYEGIFIRHPDDTDELLVPTKGNGNYITWVAFDRSTNTMVWVESDEANYYKDPVIWTAPLALSAKSIVKHEVTHYDDSYLVGGRSLVTHAGMALVPTSESSMLLVRLSDGQGWNIPSEPGNKPVQALWVNDSEIAMGIYRGPKKVIGGGVGVEGILRIARSTLGPPNVAPTL